jgi:hypothetical protein
MTTHSPHQPGPKSNGSADPTLNVREAMAFAVARIDDLRAAESRRLDDLRIAETTRVNEIMQLTNSFHDKLALAESKRIDAIRSVDVNAVAVDRERAIGQATVLAAQVSGSADTLRAAQQQLATTIDARITKLEQAQYVGQGRQAFADPAQNELMAEMKSLLVSRSASAGKTAGATAMWGYIVGGTGLFAALLSVFLMLWRLKP